MQDGAYVQFHISLLLSMGKCNASEFLFYSAAISFQSSVSFFSVLHLPIFVSYFIAVSVLATCVDPERFVREGRNLITFFFVDGGGGGGGC